MTEQDSQKPAASQGDQGTPPVDPMAPLFPVGKSQDPRDDECLSIFSDEETKSKHAALVNHATTANTLKFDQKRLSELVASSYSLTYAEKIYFLDIAIAKITQEQIDQLIQVFESEQVRFAKLHQDHQKKMKEIEEKYKDKEAMAKEAGPELETKKADAKKKDEAMVEDILKNLD